MKCAYLLIVASAAFVTSEPQTQSDDVIWYPVDNEDGVFVSIYGERRRTPTASKYRSQRRARYSGMEEYPSYNPPPQNEDPSFFHNIHDRRPFGLSNGYPQYHTAAFHNSQQNQQLISFDDNRAPQRPDYQGVNEENIQELINEVFNINNNQFPGQRPIPQNRPTNNQVFTTTTGRPFQRPTTNEWFINPSQRPSTSRPNRPNSELLVFPGETAKVTSATPTSTKPAPSTPTPTDLVPTETTTLTPCERMCPVTLEFNPVCGTDSFTYSNFSRLKCAKYCGKEVALSHFGTCGRGKTARPPRQEFRLLKTLGL